MAEAEVFNGSVRLIGHFYLLHPGFKSDLKYGLGRMIEALLGLEVAGVDH